jgi:hypothetical protein
MVHAYLKDGSHHGFFGVVQDVMFAPEPTADELAAERQRGKR